MKAYKPIPSGGLKKKESTLALTRRTEGFWILPTISRPMNLSRLIESYRDVQEDAPVFVFLWTEDPKLPENMNQQWPENWTVLLEKERFTAGDAMRKAYTYMPNAAFYGFLADDVIFHTPWSRQLATAAYPCFVAYPDDGFQHEHLCTHFVVGGEMVRKMGWWALPNVQHTGLDLVWMLIGQNVPGMLKYRPDVQWDHLHHLLEKADKDEIYEYADSLRERDEQTYENWIEVGLRPAIERAKEVLYGKATQRA